MSETASQPSTCVVPAAAPAQQPVKFIEAGELKRFLKLRKVVRFSDKVSASLGVDYDIDSNSYGPAGSLIWEPRENLSFHLNEQMLMARREWPVQLKQVQAKLKAEAVLHMRPWRPEFSVGLSDLQPFSAMATAVGAIFLLGIPVTLKDKEVRVNVLPPFNQLQCLATVQKHRSTPLMPWRQKNKWLGLQLNVQQLNWLVEF